MVDAFAPQNCIIIVVMDKAEWFAAYDGIMMLDVDDGHGNL